MPVLVLSPTLNIEYNPVRTFSSVKTPTMAKWLTQSTASVSVINNKKVSDNICLISIRNNKRKKKNEK